MLGIVCVLQFGPPIAIGSVAGSKINYFVPSWITKSLVLLVLAPATWRMVQKAKLLWCDLQHAWHRVWCFACNKQELADALLLLLYHLCSRVC